MNDLHEYIKFEEIEASKRKTKIFKCINKKSGFVIGVVKWNCGWRQYCYFPTEQTVYSSGCLFDIQEFICCLMKKRK